jgi:hypothetical protein
MRNEWMRPAKPKQRNEKKKEKEQHFAQSINFY